MTFLDALKDLKNRAVIRSRNLKSRFVGQDPSPEEQVAAAERSVEYWQNVKRLANHREALDAVMLDDVTVASNRLFSPSATPEQVNFDRGVLHYALRLTQKLSGADWEMDEANKRLESLNKHFGVEIGPE